MAKAAKKPAKEASNIFHNIMKASVKDNPKRQSFDKGQILKMENILKSQIKEMRDLGSVASSKLPNDERKAMLDRLNVHSDQYEIVGNQIKRKGD